MCHCARARLAGGPPRSLEASLHPVLREGTKPPGTGKRGFREAASTAQTGPHLSRSTAPANTLRPQNTPALFVILQELQLVIGVGSFNDVHQAEGGAEDLSAFLQDVCRVFQTCCRGAGVLQFLPRGGAGGPGRRSTPARLP